MRCAVLVLVAACGTRPTPPAASAVPPAPATAPSTLHFDWSPPCRVSVTQERDSERVRSRITYDLFVGDVGDGTLAVRFGRPHVASVNGRDFHAAARDDDEPLADGPALIIDASGSFLRLDPPLASDASDEETSWAEDHIAHWHAWVGLWVGARVPAHGTSETVHLQSDTTEVVGHDDTKPASVDVDLAPSTLRPSSVRLVVDFGDAHKTSTTWTFDWEHAVGCVISP
jgi:hypothetical protein